MAMCYRELEKKAARKEIALIFTGGRMDVFAMQDDAVLDALFSSDLGLGLAVLDRELRYRRMNSTLAAFNGVDPEAAIGRTVSEVLPSAYSEIAPLLAKVLAGEPQEELRVIAEVPSLPGQPSEWRASYLPIRMRDGAVVGILVKAVNMTLQQANQRALSASEARLRSLFEQAPEGMTLVDSEGRMLLVNRNMCRLFACEPEQLIGQHVNMLLPQTRRDTHRVEMGRYLQAPTQRVMAERRKLTALRLDGSEFPVEVALNPIPGRNPPEILATVVDITDRLAAQAAMEASLREKTLLLNEVHHRVKNNLQIVASLLNIQSRSVEGVARDVLRESRSRVGVIAMTHQLLYEGNNFSGLEFGPYLDKLVQLLKQTYRREKTRVDIVLDFPSSGMRVETQKAVPCGLIVNELIVNAYKHAFPSRDQGQIQVAVIQNGSQATLEVSDDGIGFPPGFDPTASRSMGFQLIHMLTQQIDARLEILQGPGASLRFTFQIEE
jgi:PAS domain S-box-containing protein